MYSSRKIREREWETLYLTSQWGSQAPGLQLEPLYYAGPLSPYSLDLEGWWEIVRCCSRHEESNLNSPWACKICLWSLWKSVSSVHCATYTSTTYKNCSVPLVALPGIQILDWPSQMKSSQPLNQHGLCISDTDGYAHLQSAQAFLWCGSQHFTNRGVRWAQGL